MEQSHHETAPSVIIVLVYQSSSAGTKGNSIGPLVAGDLVGSAGFVVGFEGVLVGVFVGVLSLSLFVVSVTMTSPASVAGEGATVCSVEDEVLLLSGSESDVVVVALGSNVMLLDSSGMIVMSVTAELSELLMSESDTVVVSGRRSSALLQDLMSKTVTSAAISTPKMIVVIMIGLLSSMLLSPLVYTQFLYSLGDYITFKKRVYE